MRTETPSGSRGVVTAERIAVWGLAFLAVTGLVALAVGPGSDLRTETPTVSIDAQFDAEAGAVTLLHAGGDQLTSTNTNELTVVVTDTDRNETTTVTWADRDQLPVQQGDSIVVDDPSVDADNDGNYFDGDGTVGFHLEAGDTVAVIWTGRLLGAPAKQTATLESVRLENASE